MLVMILDVVPPALRGELSRWLVPLDTTVFVGTVTAEVREHLWILAVDKSDGGRVLQVWSSRSEQGFSMRGHNLSGRRVVDFEGLQFVAVKDAAWAEAARRFALVADPPGPERTRAPAP